MISPSGADIGREVIYRARHHGAKPESGIVTSFNEHYVFVRFSKFTVSNGCRREDLHWAHAKKT
jgi:hypothetical protein